MNRNETIQEIFSIMGSTKRSLRNQFQPGFEKLGLSPAQLDLLSHIQHSEPISHKALAQRMNLTPGAVSQLLDGLDQTDLIVRAPSPSDRRVSYLSVSKLGKRKLEEFSKLRIKLFTSAFSVLDDNELSTYLRAQQKMNAWFEAQPAPSKEKI